MAGDFSRNSVNPTKHYSGVLMQQGRVQVDADWNEQLALQHHRTYTETRDVIGNCGTPKAGVGFQIKPIKLASGGGDLLISPGRYYVHGLLCELDPEKVLVSFPAGISIPAPAPSASLRGVSAATASRLKPKPLGPAKTPQVKWTDPQGQVNVPSLWFDGRQLAIGDWVEISAGKTSLLARITQISSNTPDADPNAITPNFYTLTLDHSVSAFQNAAEAWLSRSVTFTTQPFLHSQLDASLETSPPSGPGQAMLHLADGTYLVAVEAWEREVDALEDPHIREVALGGPDTAERLQTVWQVHVVPFSEETSPPGSPLESPPSSPPLDCCSDFPGWDQYKATLVTTGLMNAQAPPPGNNVGPCQIPPSAGFLGLANQLYRVEIFESGRFNSGATLVWSRDNAMVEADIICVDSTGIVYLSDLGKDDLHSFAENDWVEIFDVDDELLGNPRFLAQITAPTGTSTAPPCAPGVGQAFTLTLTPTPTAFAGRSNLRLRRWDMPPTANIALDVNGNPLGIPITPGWIQLENNVQVNFTPGFYASRSYWQIPARTATGDIEWPPYEIPNTNPIPQPPLGVPHYFCRLALLTVKDGGWHLLDCRCKFPSLTDICADDICYRSTQCDLQKIHTVEEALNELDAKIRFHNKMLHGWGVVCGLAVSCPGEGIPTSVRVAPGYAIGCEGDDLILDKETVVDFASLVTLSPQEHQIPNGEYELILERRPLPARLDVVVTTDEACCSKSGSSAPAEPCVSFRAIECRGETFLNQVCQGTIWQDFHDKCLKKLTDAFTAAYGNTFIAPLSPIASDQQVTKGQALLSSLTSLFAQAAQPLLASDVWVSPQEDALLREFYAWLPGQLHDDTFCSLLASLPAYPAYPFPDQATPNPVSTIFGMGFKTRMRVGPEGKRAYTVGIDNTIHIYDLVSGQLANVVQLPAPANSSGWVVQDVAFNAFNAINGPQIYAIATGTNPNTNAFDSLFAVGTVNNNFTVTWQHQFSAGAFNFVTLATSTESPNLVYAVVQGQGLFSIDLTKNAATQVQPSFNAIGQLSVVGNQLYATANSQTAAAATSFNEVLEFSVSPNGVIPQSVTIPLTGFTGDNTDDLLATSSPFNNFEGFLLFVTATATGSSNTNKQLLSFFTFKPAFAPLDLGEKATVRLAANLATNSLMVTFEESCRIKNVTSAGSVFALSPYWPTEVNPTAIALSGAGALGSVGGAGIVYVLNSTSNTISPISATLPAFNDFPALENYRTSAIDAYIQLFAAFLQDLKDCFCELLLVNCPTCTSEEERLGVPLACVTFREGKVFRVCNFEKRKYVKTFSTVEYWLSTVPVVPLVRAAFERFCCAVLPTLLANFKAPTPKNQPGYTSFTGSITPAGARNAISQFQKLTVNNAFTSAFNAIKPTGTFALDALFQPLQATPAANSVQLSQVTGQPLRAAQQTLANANINVAAVATYDPSDFARNFVDYASAPSTLPPGSSVTLVTDSKGLVKYYIPSPAEVTQLRTTVQANQNQVESQITAVNTSSQQLQTQVTALQQAQKPALDQVQLLQTQVTTLQTQLTNLQTTHAQELATRDQQIATLTTTTQQLQTKLTAVDDLTAQVKQLAAQIPPKPKA